MPGILPIVERELRVASRLRRTYWHRGMAAALAFVALLWIIDARAAGSEGAFIFRTLSVVLFLFCAGGACFTYDCLSQEKREGTLGLLFLTDLQGHDVIFGKLAAHSLRAVYGLVAVFPILAVPLLMGGVTLGEFGRVCAITLNLLFLSLAIGLCCSAVFRNDRQALGVAAALLLVLTAGPPLLGLWITGTPAYNPYLWFSPAYPCFLYAEPLYLPLKDTFWTSLAITGGYALLFLGMASLIVPHTWQEKPLHKSSVGGRALWNRVLEGSAAARRARRTHQLARNPFYWLAARPAAKHSMVWLFLLILAVFWYLRYSDLVQWQMITEVLVATGLAAHLVLRFWVASEASRRFAEDRQSGALELLLSTPMTVADILKGQYQALMRQFGLPVAAVLIFDLAALIAIGRDTAGPTETAFWVFFWISAMGLFVSDLVVLARASMWVALNSGRSHRGSFGALARILGIPSLIFFLVVISDVPDNLSGALLFWVLIRVINSTVFFCISSSGLQEDFRAVASRPLGAPKVQADVEWTTDAPVPETEYRVH